MSKRSAIMRADVLASNMTATKAAVLRNVLHRHRAVAPMLGREQWRLFFETGAFNKQHDVDKVTFRAVTGNARQVQMARYQVAGQLQSWISNRANEFRDVVTTSTLAPEIKHALHTINVQQAWWCPGPVRMFEEKRPTGPVIADDTRRLARSIMRGVCRRHRRPDLSRISMWVDARAVTLAKPIEATQTGAVDYWARFVFDRQVINVPLLGNPYQRARNGDLAKGLMIIEDRESGTLRFGIATDIRAECARSRAVYQPQCEALPLDFGLSTMFATGEGDLLGRDWLTALKRYDERVAKIARGMQRRKQKPRQSRRYREAVSALRGWIKSEVNRVLNRLIEVRAPAKITLERLDFRNPTLSRRMNRILQNCGRSVIRAKLADLKDRLGIISGEFNPAYTSQTCSNPRCGYVDKRNRNGAVFCCRWCGKKLHADVNGSRNIGARRASPLGSVFLTKAKVLAELVTRFRERWLPAGGNGSTINLLAENDYFVSSLNVAIHGGRQGPLHEKQ
jgi:putative transposase